MTGARSPQTDPAATLLGAVPLDLPSSADELVPRTAPVDVRPEAVAALRSLDQPQQAPTPMALLTIAMNQGADLDRLERLMVMQERWEANEARRAFNAAFAAFKAEAVTIVKAVTYTDGPLKGRKYADLFAVVDAATPALAKHGLSASWRLTRDEKDWLEVACTLRHAMGHSETVTMGGAPDTGGAKSAIQARASSVAYLERYTFLAITGLAAKDQDRDGQTPKAPAAQVDELPEADFQEHLKNIHEAGDDDALKAAFAAAKEACHPQDKRTLDAFEKAKNARYRVMHPKAPGGGK